MKTIWKIIKWTSISLLFAGVLGYGALRFIPPIHQLALETIVTTGHRKYALLFASQSEINKTLQIADGNPHLAATRILNIQTPPSSTTQTQRATLPKPLYTTTPIFGPTWHGWLTVIPNPKTVHVIYAYLIGRYGEKISHMAPRLGAVAAINGGGFLDVNGMGNGGEATGALISDGHVLQSANGELVIGLTQNGTLVAGHFSSAQVQTLGITQAVSWRGPILVVNGVGQITWGDGGWGYGPRTAIGQTANGTIIWVTIDGRQIGSLGASMLEVQQLMLKQGAVTAVALDGGASTVLWESGQVVNHPCSFYGERYVPDGFAVIPTN